MKLLGKVCTFIVLVLVGCAVPKQHFYINPQEKQDVKIQHFNKGQVLVSNKDKYNVVIFPRIDYIDREKFEYMPFSISLFNKTDGNVYISYENIFFYNNNKELTILRKGEAASYILSMGMPDYRGMTPEQIMEFSRRQMLLDKEQSKYKKQLLSLIDEKYMGYENIKPKDFFQALIFVDLPIYGGNLQVIVELPGESHYFDYLIR